MQILSNKSVQYTLTKRDLKWMILIVVLYGSVSFVRLGTFSNPQTFWNPSMARERAVVSLNEVTSVSKVRHFTGPRSGIYKMYGSTDNKSFSYIGEMTQKKVFVWADTNINYNLRYLAFIADKNTSFMGDIALYDKEGKKLHVYFETDNAQVLVDEAEQVPDKISYLNSMYFDEIYHARTAYEHVHGMAAYEWTHPPLGKLIIGIPIGYFGMNPFAYRLMGNIAGILMLVVIYILAKRLFGSERSAILACVLLAVDGMHFVQTRIATVDSFLALFIMLSYLFMYQYLLCKENERLGMKLSHLFFSGLFMGAAIATKWSGMYGALGLAIIFFVNLFKKYNQHHGTILPQRHTGIIIISCFVFFIVIPLGLYVLAYFPFFDVQFNTEDKLGEFIKLQKAMYKYHAGLEASHPFASPWYLWPLNIKPVWYYKGEVPKGFVATIAAMGNPIIWWSGIVAVFYTLKEAIYYKEQKNVYIVIAIFALYLPYIFIDRVMFLYHYFPVVPFLILAIVKLLEGTASYFQKPDLFKWYGVASGISFLFFYPIYSGMIVPKVYVILTRWLADWQFYSGS
ncbi:phospholipid carrier-dependent glycosyltransferase [Cellulosilyticum sp. I15G10I2]|uniref:phospholipid carrier-dependent glycosyltransferase n=1 Tax=Cellulosilyticum sp. I15G10I2 TaxID=1892843 RepID=UPI00085BD785|nr:phospholipid carrier-dependent glycosyltransferase [Cellulosilyticum sp. I15G10I2]